MTDPHASQFRRWFDDDRVFAALLTFVFIVLTSINIHHHVMWRDEVRSWQVVQISPTFASLRHNLDYFGVPYLWYLLLWWVSFFFSGMGAMKGLHVAIAAAVVFVFCWRAPFGKLIRALFPFGYYTFFEYAVISRNYSLLFLFILIAAAIISLPTQRPMALAIATILMAQVSVWGIAIAALMLGVGVLKALLDNPRKFLWLPWLTACALVVCGCALGYYEAQPSPGQSYIARWNPQATAIQKLGATIGTVWKGWFPIPSFERHFWNTNIFDAHLNIQCSLGCILLLLALLALLRRPVALLMFLGGSFGLMAVTYFMFVGVNRHNGHLFMVLIASCWIAESSREWSPRTHTLAALTSWCDRYRWVFLLVILCVQVPIGIGAVIADAKLPFSAGKAVAEYIEKNIDPSDTIMAIDDYCADPVSAYLHRDLYYPQMRCVAPYNTQNDAARFPVTLDSLFDDIRLHIMKTNHDVLLLLSSGRVLVQQDSMVEFPSQFGPKEIYQIKVLPKFDDSTVEDEAQSLYLIHRVQ